MKMDVPPKVNINEEFNELFEIDLNAILENGLDDKGNIQNGSEQINNYLIKLIEKEKGPNFFDELEFEDVYGWKSIKIQHDLVNFLKIDINKKDIDNIILIKYIADIEIFLNNLDEGDMGSNIFVINSLKQKLNDSNTTIIERLYLKNVIHSLQVNDGFCEINDYEKFKKERLEPLEREIGEGDDLNLYYDEDLSKIKFSFNKEQRASIINDSFNKLRAYDDSEEIRPLDKQINYKKGRKIEGDYVVSWLTPKIVGLYSLQGSLIGWQNYEDINESGENKLEDIFDFKKESAINSKEDIALFKVSSSLYFREYVQKTLNIDLSKLNLNNQFYFLNFIQGKKESDIEKFKRFIMDSKSDEDKINKFKTFLSIEQGGKDMGDKIIELGEKLPKDVAEKVFGKYGEIINQTDDLENFIKINFSNDLLENPNFIIELRDSMLEKAKNLLLSYFDKTKDDKIDKDKLLKDLDNLQIEKELLFTTVKLSKTLGKEISLENILSLDLEIISPEKVFLAKKLLTENRDQLSEVQIKKQESLLEDVRQMEEIYSENYSNNLELQKSLVDDFHKFIYYEKEDPQERSRSGFSEVYLLKYKGKVLSFDRFDVDFNTRKGLYFKSFNVEKNLQNSGVGSMMTKATLEKKAKEGYKILADCISSKPISSFYIENGFIAKKLSSLYGESILSLIRKDKEVQNEFKTKLMSKEDILADNGLPEGTIVKKYLDQKSCDFSYVVPENFTKKEEILPYRSAPEKYVLTRYFFNKITKEWVTVFEPLKRPLNDFL